MKASDMADMPRNLIDVNVLIALLDPVHPAHAKAHLWADTAQGGYATCPIVQNGVFRIMTQPAYANGGTPLSLSVVMDAFVKTIANIDHELWGEPLSLADTTVFDRRFIHGPRQLTDIYLLGLAVQKQGRLVTLDRNIPLQTVRGATPAHMLVL
jgi:toxin-antitoxin system PIN domain toxin